MTDCLHQNQREGDGVLLPFAKAHLAGALTLSQEMAWPYRLADWEFALELGQGFVLAHEGVVVGTAAWWPYGQTGASAGMIIVSKAFQGRGYGARLMDAVLAAAGPRTIQLNSTDEGRLLYERRGFRAVGLIHQHQGILPGSYDASPNQSVRAAMPDDHDAIAGLDCDATGWVRPQMIGRLIDVAQVYVLERDGAVAGFAMSRLFGRGHVVGPVMAATAADARALIEASLVPLKGCFVRIDTSSTSGLGEWLVELGLGRVSDALTMVLGNQAPPRGAVHRYALVNQSFG